MYRKDLAYQEAAEPQARKVKTENFSFDQVKSLKDQIFQFKNPVISAHLTPDGDAYGSMIALAIYLKSHGQEPTVVLGEKDEIPQIFSELMIKEGITVARSLPENCDGVIILDTAVKDLSILEMNTLPNNIPIIEIDHHLTYPLLTTSENTLSSERYSSTAEMLSNFFEKGQINPTMAKSLVLGILADTHNLEYMTRPTTENELTFLIEIFAENQKTKEVQLKLHKELSNLSETELIMLDQHLANISAKPQYILQKSDKAYKLQIDFISKKESEELSQDVKVFRENLSDAVSQATQADLVLIVYYDNDKGKFRVSLRNFIKAKNDDLNLRLLVAQFGGGGQRGAVGFDFGLDTSNEEEQKARLGVIVTKISEAFNNPE